MENRNLEDQIRRLATLSEPTRCALYLYVVGLGRDVGRDEASRALGLSRALAAFHLDRLVEDGLLEATFRRLTETTGPGAGRPAKLYRRSGLRVEITLPQTRYEMLSRLLVRAVAESGTAPAAQTLSMLASDLGAEIGGEARRRAGGRASRAALLEKAIAVMAENGFEPFTSPQGEILLRNCPFDAAARENREIVCGMNLALMEGLLRGLRVQGIAARLDPKPGFCCVAIGPREGTSDPSMANS